MANCTPSYSADPIPIDPAECGEDCEGVSFSLESMTTSTDAAGRCTFSWLVRRKVTGRPGSKDFTGSMTLDCPSDKTVVFYCKDDSTDCPAFKLTLSCKSS